MIPFNELFLAKKQLLEVMAENPKANKDITTVKYAGNVELVEASMSSKVVYTWRNLWKSYPKPFCNAIFDRKPDEYWFIFMNRKSHYIVYTDDLHRMKYIAKIIDY